MRGENGKKEKGLSDYGIIYLSGPIEVETSESTCKEIIEYNISGKTDHIQMIINLRDVDTWLAPDEAVKFGLVDLVEPLKPHISGERRG